MTVGPLPPSDNINFKVNTRKTGPQSRSSYFVLALLAFAVVLSFGIFSIVAQHKQIAELNAEVNAGQIALQQKTAELAQAKQEIDEAKKRCHTAR